MTTPTLEEALAGVGMHAAEIPQFLQHLSDNGGMDPKRIVFSLWKADALADRVAQYRGETTALSNADEKTMRARRLNNLAIRETPPSELDDDPRAAIRWTRVLRRIVADGEPYKEARWRANQSVGIKHDDRPEGS